MSPLSLTVTLFLGNLVQWQEDAPFGMTAKYMNYVLMTIQMQDFRVRVRTQDFHNVTIESYCNLVQRQEDVPFGMTAK